jgi:hypothetical protein
MYSKDYVTALVASLGALTFDPAVEVGSPDAFGLGLDLFDPVSGQIITVARPQRADIGQSEILLTPAQVAQAVNGARMNRLHQVRAAGFASLEAAAEFDKQAAESAALRTKQAEELAALQTTHAEATAAAAAAAQPKPAETAEQKQAREDQEERDRLAAEQSGRRPQPQARPNARPTA